MNFLDTTLYILGAISLVFVVYVVWELLKLLSGKLTGDQAKQVQKSIAAILLTIAFAWGVWLFFAMFM